MIKQAQNQSAGTLPVIVHRWVLQIINEYGDDFLSDSSSKRRVLPVLTTLLADGATDDKLDNENIVTTVQTAYKNLPTFHNLSHEYPIALRENLDNLSDLVGFSTTEWHILGLAILLKTEPMFEGTADVIEGMSFNQVVNLLTKLLNRPIDDIRHALNPKALLAKSGLLKVERPRRHHHDFSNFFNLLCDEFADNICQPDMSIDDLLKEVIQTPPQPQLNRANFSHIEPQLSLLVPYLNSALASNKTGGNIFIYGPPGTGKTQLSRLLANLTDSECLEVICQDSDGDVATERQRLRAFTAAQSCFARQRIFLVFDEVEEILGGGSSPFSPSRNLHKSWFNHNLENNAIPTIWLSNDVGILDNAFIRRFDMIFELPIPPKKQRKALIENLDNKTLTPQFIDRLSDNEHVAPAVISRAVDVVQSAQQTVECKVAQQNTEEQMTMLINQKLEAQGKPMIEKASTNQLAVYSPEYINTDRDMSELVTGIKNAPSARLCFYGRPGTGKTAYAKYLAKQLGKPLVVKKASDLLSPYVGMAEKQIAAAFRQAEQDNAVLLIDEADSFLRDRSYANRNWEISQVNEMLTQMESYNGIFIATTNLMDDIDAAAMRRFDMKLCFHYLTEKQSQGLLADYAKLLGLKPPNKRIKTQIAELTTLTTGDFAAVARRHRFAPFTTLSEFVAALKEECKFKQDKVKMPIGFY